MALPKDMRLKGHRSFEYLHKNSIKYHGKLMSLKIAKANPHILLSHKNKTNLLNLRLAISISKKFSKKSVFRNKVRRSLQNKFLKDFQKEKNHIPYWVLVNLKAVKTSYNEEELLKDFQNLIFKSGVIK